MIQVVDELEKVEGLLDRLREISETSVKYSCREKIPVDTHFESLELTNLRRFRGSVTIPLSSAFTLLYAPNGVGKTTLTDSLELIKNGKTPRRDAYRVAAKEIKEPENLKSWGKEGEDAFARLRSEGGEVYEWRLSDKATQIRESVPLRTISRLNLRTQVDATPRNRFDFVSSLLPEESFGIDANEVDTLIGNIKESLQNADSEAQEIDRHFRGLGYESAPTTFGEVADKITKLEEGNRSSLDEIRRLEARLRDTQQHLRNLSLPFETAEPQFKKVRPQAPEGAKIVAALKQILPHVHKGQLCPLCAEGHISEGRIEDITSLIDAYSKYLTDLEAYDKEKNKYEKTKSEWEEERNRLVCALNSSQIFLGGAENHKVISDLSDAEVERQRQKLLDELGERVTQIQSDISLNAGLEEIQELSRLKAFWEANAHWGDSLKERDDRLNHLRSLVGKREELDRVAKEIKLLKGKMVDARLQSIEEPVSQWWRLLAPENTDFDLSFELTGKEGSGVDIYCVPRDLTVLTRGKVKPKHAMGVLSDSQIDLLSISFNFATLEEEIGKGLVWLDDPSDAFDTANIDNFISGAIPKLLSCGHQVVLCTHSKEIVKRVWSYYTEIVESVENEAREPKFRQLSLDVELENGGDGSGPFAVVAAPFGLENAREQFEQDFKGVEGQSGQMYKHGTRLRLANSLRRVCEFLFSAVLDALEPLVPPQQRRYTPWIEDSKMALGDYRETACKRMEQLILDVSKAPNEILSEGQAKGLRHALEKLLNRLGRIDSTILNEGSHADLVIPHFREIKKSWSVVNEIAGLLIPVGDEKAAVEYRIKGLDAIYPGGKLGDSMVKLYATDLNQTESISSQR